MKFGGASLASRVSIENNIGHIKHQLHLNPVLVFSAMGKTTVALLHAARLSAQGKPEEAQRVIDKIERKHLTLFRGLNLHERKKVQGEKLSLLLHQVAGLIGGLAHKGLTLQEQDAILAYGELMSTVFMEAALQASDINAKWMDARRLIITSAGFSCAKPLREKTDLQVREKVQEAVDAGYVPVIQGFIGSTEDGRTTTLGFEGSDYTASLLGAALESVEIQIWKAVPGIMTADPHLVAEARTVAEVTFEEAAELAFYGAKVLHPSTIEPARAGGIPIGIYDVRHSSEFTDSDDRTGKAKAKGTAIVPKAGSQLSIKSITGKRALAKVVLHFGADRMIHKDLPKIYDIFDECGVPVVLSLYKKEMIAAFPDAAVTRSLSRALKAYGRVEVFRDKASLTVIGSLGTEKGALAEKVERALGGIACEAVSDIMSSSAMTFLFDGNVAGEALKRVHNALFSH